MTTPLDAVLGSGNIITFSVDYGTTFTIQEGDALWSDGITVSTASPSGDNSNSNRTSKALSTITVPGGLTLDNYNIHNVFGEIYRTIAGGAVDDAWGYSGKHNSAASSGFFEAFEYGGKIITQVGSSGIGHKSSRVARTPFGDSVNAFLAVTGIPSKAVIVCSLK